MGAKILVADDDDEIRDLIKFFLEQEGYHVLEALNGEEAVNKAFTDIPDLILLDIMMPKMNGFEVCEKIRSNAKTCLIPIIMLTSMAQTKDKITGIKLGADEYLTKPFENFELIARIEGLLRRYKENKSASPLTGLPGNIALENEVKNRLSGNTAFSLLLIDINGFKVYNDKYSFEQGDDVLKVFGAIIRSVYSEMGDKDDVVAYLGEDDFAVVTVPEKSELEALKIVENFEAVASQFYDEDVVKRGYIWTKNENNEDVQHPLLSVSIGNLLVEPGAYKHYSQVMTKSKELLKQAKKKQQQSA